MIGPWRPDPGLVGKRWPVDGGRSPFPEYVLAILVTRDFLPDPVCKTGVLKANT